MFEEVVPSILPQLKEHIIMARTCWYCQLFHLSIPDLKKRKRRRMDRNFFFFKENIYKWLMANASAIWQQTAHNNYQLSSPSCLTRAIQKSLTKKFEKFLEKGQENGLLAEKWQRKRTRLKKKRGDRKGESNDHPEIPDRGTTSTKE